MKFERNIIEIDVVCAQLGIDLESMGYIQRGFCPYHSEGNASFTVYTDTNSWYCFSCSRGGGPLQLVKSFVDEVVDPRSLRRWYETSASSVRVTHVKPSPSSEKVMQTIARGLGHSIALPPSILSSNELLRSLGISYVSEGKLVGRHIIPIKHRGAPIAFEARDFFGKMIPKTLILPPKVRIHSYLWHVDAVDTGDSIVVVEGIKDAIAVIRHGWNSVVSSFGAKLSLDQISLLIHKTPKDVTIAYDADKAGIEGMIEAANQLSAWTRVYTLTLPDGSDPWDISRAAWIACMKRRSLVVVKGLDLNGPL